MATTPTPAEKQYTDDGIEITTFTDAEKAKVAEELAARQAQDAADDAPTE
jgi:hypothetical protein